MPFVSIDSADIQVKKPLTQGLMQKIKDSLDFLYGQLGFVSSESVANGSFQLDTDGDGIPNEWTRNLYAGGSGGVTSADHAEGDICLAMTSPGGAGNGGAYFDSNYIPCSSLSPRVLGLAHKSTYTGLHNQVQVLYYDAAKVYLSTATLYDSTSNPTDWTYYLLGIAPPAGARWMKIRLVGGNSDVTGAGTAYFDALTLQPLVMRNLSGARGQAFPDSTSWTTFVDVASMVVNLPYRGLKMNLTLVVPMTLSYSSNGVGLVRLRVDANIGPSVQGTVPAGEAVSPQIPLTESSGQFTVYVQVESNGTDWATVRKDDTALTGTVIAPTNAIL